MNARRTPQQIYPRHMGDELANLGVHARPYAPPASVMPALKDKAEALSAPFENGTGLNNDQGTSPARPKAGQYQRKSERAGLIPRSADNDL